VLAVLEAGYGRGVGYQKTLGGGGSVCGRVKGDICLKLFWLVSGGGLVVVLLVFPLLVHVRRVLLLLARLLVFYLLLTG